MIVVVWVVITWIYCVLFVMGLLIDCWIIIWFDVSEHSVCGLRFRVGWFMVCVLLFVLLVLYCCGLFYVVILVLFLLCCFGCYDIL